MENKNNNSESLAKSHSKASNFKLTLLAITAALIVFGFWTMLYLALKGTEINFTYLIISIAFLVLSLLTAVIISKFKR
ncbi:MAG: hypothetical protein WCR67_06605 [Bacilli bacterium]